MDAGTLAGIAAIIVASICALVVVSACMVGGRSDELRSAKCDEGTGEQ